MKYAGILAILAMIPLTAALLSSGAGGRRLVAFFLGAIPFFMQSAHIIVAPISWRYWPGYVKGAEISIVDGMALGIILCTYRNRAAANYVIPFFLLAACAVFSARGTIAPPAAMFVAWQMFRVYLIYVAVTRLAANQANIAVMLGGMVAGLGCNAVAAAIQHLGGVYQAPGLFGHQNTLGLIAHYVSLPAAALFMADRRAMWPLLGVGAAAAVALLGASRATVGLEAGALALLVVFAIMIWPTARAMSFMAMAVIGMAVMAPVAYVVLTPRFVAAEVSDYDERQAFTNVAKAMMHDHPTGVGANFYVISSNADGYARRFHVALTTGSLSANVHNAYLLTGAEMGWAALVPFVWLTVLTALHGLYWSFRSSDKRLALVLLGTSMAQFAVAVHNVFEWIFVTYAVQVLFCINLGLVAALVGAVRKSRVESEPAAEPANGPALRAPALASAASTE